ncbi:TonB-dependent receptor [Pedobacter sp. MC2016-14]|uniref:TonB-dependent receptor n=1 Tax=Pedobacter sp. MC2016-14 TaxID=2897327 RepID=UPI001E46A59E|nr:TonB-dependent receptor [Pedobacter sp. MC2016-14]MCD0488862.1 TonB-dependent receptor [Pedobacter sp. MC2016-14]
MKKTLLIVFMAILSFSLKAQITTSTLSGLVRDNTAGIPGATVVAVHTPTGTKYSTNTRSDGRFTLSNVNIGGPYTITVTYVGYQPLAKSGVTAALGDDVKVDFNLQSDTRQLQEVKVTGAKRTNSAFDKNSLNTTTVFDAEKLASTPTMNRNLNDFVRHTPQAKADYQGGISIAGQNNKYNSVSINGAPANDQFGLAATGTNGGQASSSPIPVDAIDQLQVNVSPFDVRYSGFLGGSINAVTKSGTNKVTGGFSYFLRNQNLAGKTPTDNESIERIKLPDFTAKTYSANLGGALIKNKLFLFVAGEYQKSETPKVFDYATYTGAVTQTQIESLINTLKGPKYNYDPGNYLNNPAIVDRKAITAKLDWNISSKHQFSLFYNYIDAKNVSTLASSRTAINFDNGAIVYPNKTHQFTGELKSNFSNKVSNSLLIGYTDVLDDRGSKGSPFPSVTIRDGASSNIYFGTEAFSAANQLKQKTYSLINETKLYSGQHTFSLIEDAEYNDYYNLFIRQAYGAYVYSSLDNFLNDAGPASYNYSYSLVDDIIGDGSAAAAKFKTYRVGLALQDKWDLATNTTIMLGLRGDLIGYGNNPIEDTYFNNTALGYIQNVYNLDGARSGQAPKAYISLSPRFAIKHSLNDGATQFRGGMGLFQARITAVTPGGMFSNSGTLIGGTQGSPTNNPLLNGVPLPFQPDVNKQYRAERFGAAASSPSGEINIMAKNYKSPKVVKFNFAVDQKLPGDIIASLEGNYTVNVNQTMYYNVNLIRSQANAVGVDNRPLYSTTKIDFNPSTAGIQNPYTNVYLVTNGGSPGRSYVVSASLAKKFPMGLDVSTSYTYSRALVVNEPTSSQNSSQWRNMETAYGKNMVSLSNSDFDFGHLIRANATYTKDWFKFGGTSIGLFYTGQSGTRFTYVSRNSILGDDGFATNNDLIYVPNAASELNFVPLTLNGVTYTAAQQSAAFDNYINNDPYLKKRRGNYAERNGGRLPFVNMFDLHAEQNFFVKIGNSKQHLAVSFDINNVGNLLNKNWGRFYYLTNDNYQLLTVTAVNATTRVPSYTFNPTVLNAKDNAFSIQDFSNYNSSRWTGQLGLKYFFN